MRLVIFDMDGTILEDKNVWLALHRRLGTLEEGKRATDEWLYEDYDRLVDIVIHNLWRGKPAKPFLDLVAEVEYLPGVEETVKELQRRGYEVAVITSGPSLLLDRIREELGVRHGFGNVLDVEDGIITGRSRRADGSSMWPVRADNKVPLAERLCRELGVRMEDAIAVGDERNDLPLFRAVGTSIAFNTENEELRRAATHHVEGNDLRKILPLLPPLRVRRGVAAIVSHGGKFLLARRDRMLLADGSLAPIEPEWDLVKGGVEEGEDPGATVLRELEEETDSSAYRIVAEVPERLIYPLPAKSGYASQETAVFLVEYTGDGSDLTPDADEVGEVEFFSREEALERIKYPETKAFFGKHA